MRNKKRIQVFHLQKEGTHEKNCSKFHKWLEKKGKPISFVCYESNMVDVNHDTLWIDSSSTIHISNTLLGTQNLRKLVGSE